MTAAPGKTQCAPLRVGNVKLCRWDKSPKTGSFVVEFIGDPGTQHWKGSAMKNSLLILVAALSIALQATAVEAFSPQQNMSLAPWAQPIQSACMSCSAKCDKCAKAGLPLPTQSNPASRTAPPQEIRWSMRPVAFDSAAECKPFELAEIRRAPTTSYLIFRGTSADRRSKAFCSVLKLVPMSSVDGSRVARDKLTQWHWSGAVFCPAC